MVTTLLAIVYLNLTVFHEDGNRVARLNIYNWFQDLGNLTAPLYVRSGWGYMTQEQYNVIIDDPAKAARIHKGDSVFELGCGVGAALARLRESPGVGVVGGCDFSEAQINGVRREFPGGRFFKSDMTARNTELSDNSFDHVASFGAAGLYLTWQQMQQATKEAARITKPGGTVVFTHLIEPWRPRRGSILHPIPMSRWGPLVREVGGESMIIRYHWGTPKPWRYYVTFTVGP
jgi:ubiquinone/menaquinone biosynthesis C-methylase UbiE